MQHDLIRTNMKIADKMVPKSGKGYEHLIVIAIHVSQDYVQHMMERDVEERDITGFRLYDFKNGGAAKDVTFNAVAGSIDNILLSDIRKYTLLYKGLPVGDYTPFIRFYNQWGNCGEGCYASITPSCLVYSMENIPHEKDEFLLVNKSREDSVVQMTGANREFPVYPKGYKLKPAVPYKFKSSQSQTSNASDTLRYIVARADATKDMYYTVTDCEAVDILTGRLVTLSNILRESGEGSLKVSENGRPLHNVNSKYVFPVHSYAAGSAKSRYNYVVISRRTPVKDGQSDSDIQWYVGEFDSGHKKIEKLHVYSTGQLLRLTRDGLLNEKQCYERGVFYVNTLLQKEQFFTDIAPGAV